MVNRSGATVLVVGAGGIKQEIWIAKYRHRMPCILGRCFVGILGRCWDFGTLFCSSSSGVGHE